MAYAQWYEMKLKEKTTTIDLYIADAFQYSKTFVLLWHEPVISDWEPENYDHPCADRHFQKRILSHIWAKWKEMRVEVLPDGLRVSPLISSPK